MKPMKYTTVLFDADDTLFDFGAAETDAIRSVLRLYGLPSDDSVIAEYSRINIGFWKMLERGEIKKDELKIKRFEAFCEHFGFDADAVEMAHSYMSELSKQSRLLDGSMEICERLFGKCRIYVITNGIKFIQEGRFSASPITKYFDGVFISEVVGFDKPKREYFEAVASAIPDFDKEKTLVVGDSLTSDIAGGINFGLDTCWFNPKGKPCPEDMNITYVIDSIDKVYDIVTAE
jgi:2-haloacid dehalogenase